MADLSALRVVVRGRVQGVFFRAFAQRWAKELNLTGFVRNRPDGAVEAVAEGERANLEKFLGYLKTGPPAARVETVEADWADYTGSFSGFSTQY